MDNQELFQDESAGDILRNSSVAPPSDVWNRIENSLNKRRRKIFLWWFIPVAGVSLLGVGAFNYFNDKHSSGHTIKTEIINDHSVNPHAGNSTHGNESNNSGFAENTNQPGQISSIENSKTSENEKSNLKNNSLTKAPLAVPADNSPKRRSDRNELIIGNKEGTSENTTTIKKQPVENQEAHLKNGKDATIGIAAQQGTSLLQLSDLNTIKPFFINSDFPVTLNKRGTEFRDLTDITTVPKGNFYMGLYSGTSLRNVISSKTTPDSIRLLRPFNNLEAGLNGGYIFRKKLTLNAGFAYERTEWQAESSRIVIVSDTDSVSLLPSTVAATDVYIINSFEGTNSVATGDFKKEILNNYQSEQGRLVHSIERLKFSLSAGYMFNLSPRAGIHAALQLNYLYLLKENSRYLFGDYMQDFGTLPSFQKNVWEINPALTFSYRFTKHLAFSLNTGYSRTLSPVYERPLWNIGEQAWHINGGITYFFR